MQIGRVSRASLAALSLTLVSCGGGSPTPTPTPIATATPTPTPTPSPTPTYTKLADLVGNQTFQTATVTYTDDANVNGLLITSASAQMFGMGTVIDFIDASGIIRLTAPGGAPLFEFFEGNPTRSDATSRTWESNNGGIINAVTLFNPQNDYAFLGTWLHIENGLATFRLAAAGVPTQAGDYPAGTVVYNISTGGVTINGATTNSVNAQQSRGTLTMNFATGQGTFSVELKDAAGSGLGTVTGTVTRAANGNGFAGTIGFQGVDGQVSGAFFGPQGREIALASVVNNANGTVSYVGLGGGIPQ